MLRCSAASAERWRRAAWPPASARGTQSASAKLFRDAEAEEDAEQRARARLRRAQRASEPVWTGDERIEDTVLRMLEHKYKPMRRGEDGRAAEKKRLERVLRPTVRPRTAQDEVGANGVVIRRTGDNPWDLFLSLIHI